MGGHQLPETTERWVIAPELARAMTQVARKLRRDPTPSEDRLWHAIRKEQLDGRKFRRQMPIGPFVVDFYCAFERLIVEVDGPIHESQRAADQQRQAMLESLGLRFVRVTAAQVENHLSDVLQAIRTAFHPSPLVGEGPGMGGTDPYPAYRAISAAARQLHQERGAWLNPPGLPEPALKPRTLTNLYNALQVFRGEDSGRVVPAAGDFAPRLDVLHRALDEAVCDAYGWEYDVLADEEEILRRLLALNLERAARQGDG
jgi:very-short-patch-repair endonuclease